jgi:hypothetical protein
MPMNDAGMADLRLGAFEDDEEEPLERSSSVALDPNGPPPPASLAGVQIRGRRRAQAPQGGDKAELYENVLRAPAPLPVVPPAPVEDGRAIEDLVTYWARLRRGPALPSPVDLDRAVIAVRWPNSGLLSYETPVGETASGQPMPRSLPLSDKAPTADDAWYIPLTPLVIEWVLDLAGRAIRSTGVAWDTQRFPDAAGGRLEVVVLPLALRRAPDHVLYHLQRA